MTMMETQKKGDGDVVVFMFLCHFLLFGMSELEWMLLDTSLTGGDGATKQGGVNEVFTGRLIRTEEVFW
jgi:hypothetical protein